MTSLTVFIGVVIFGVLLFSGYVKWIQKYWARRKIPYIQPTSLFGNVNPIDQKENLSLYIQRYYNELKRNGHKHGGVYLLLTPLYIPVDVNLVKDILTKDFQHFTDRGIFPVDEKKDPLSAHIFNLGGEQWRNIRLKVTPTFTSGKMKMMFKTLLDCGVPMLEHINDLSKTRDSLDIKEIVARYTTDIIGSCAFGLQCNSFKDPDADFRKYGRKSLTPSYRSIISQFLTFLSPSIQPKLRFKLMHPDVEQFFLNTIKNVIDHRRKNGIKRDDFIHLFIEMQDRAKADNVKPITLEQIAAQCFLFFLGGFETSSTTMTFCLHELAYNQDIQTRLREEVRQTFKENYGVLSYDAIMNMKYMNKVVNETLRKYPPVPILNRECTLDYRVPGTDATIKKGTKVFISTLGIHRDEEFYPEPNKFDPERFSEEIKSTRPQYSFLPFGEGPRNCTGLRFGYMQTKTGLSMLLNNFRFTPAENQKYNMEFDRRTFTLTKRGEILLNVEKLSVFSSIFSSI